MFYLFILIFSKKYIIVLSFIVILLIVLLYFFNSNRTILVKKYTNFKHVYSVDTDFKNIQIQVLNPLGNIVSTITNKEDITTIINMIKNEEITPINKSEELLGKAYRFNIINSLNKTNLYIYVSQGQITFNSLYLFKTNRDLTTDLKEIYLKYDSNPLY